MPTPTYEQCCDLCRFHLSDSLQEIWNNDGASGKTSLALPFGIAFREMFAEMENAGVTTPEKTVWCNIAAYVTTLTPAQAGILDLGKLQSNGVWERGSFTAVTITDVANATSSGPIQITATAHDLTTNQEVVISGVSGATVANGRWFANVIDADTFQLIGSPSGAAYVSGGVVTTSAEKFRSVTEVEDLTDRAPVDRLAEFDFDNDTFYFVGATTARQLRITYLMSGTPPVTGSVGVEGSLNFLAARMAGLAGPPKGNRSADVMNVQALGPNRDGSGGFLWDLINPMVKQGQSIPSVRQRFRARRSNVDTFGLY